MLARDEKMFYSSESALSVTFLLRHLAKKLCLKFVLESNMNLPFSLVGIADIVVN